MAERVRRHLLSQLLCLGRHTLTGVLGTSGRLFCDWSADYRMYSSERVDSQKLFSTCLDLLGPIANKSHAALLVGLFKATASVNFRCDILNLLSKSGCENEAVALSLQVMQTTPVQSEDWDFSGRAAIDILANSSLPEATEAMRRFLADTNAPPDARNAAFVNLARTDGERGLQAILAAKDQRRTLRGMCQAMRLQEVPATVVTAEKTSIGSFGAPRLLKVWTSPNTRSWGALASPLMGDWDDVWLVEREGNAWVNHLLSDMNEEAFGKVNSLSNLFQRTEMTQDSDGDGWTDLMERKIGTNVSDADSDGDGIKDSEDRNPLVAPRKLNEIEEILYAAFEARFLFLGERNVLCLVDFPKGTAPFELRGWDWVILPNGKMALRRNLWAKGRRWSLSRLPLEMTERARLSPLATTGLKPRC